MEYPNWFNYTAKANFEKFLTQKGKLELLQLGVYTGDASLWMLENLGDVELTDVDTWKGSNEEAHKSLDFDDIYNVYIDRISKYRKQVDIRRCTTTDFLLAQYGCDRPLGQHWDFIYIDADHTAVGVLMDAELSWPLLKSGGIMAFDDYTWGPDMPPEITPTLGIDLFLERHTKEYDTLIINAQVWIRKI
jgi:predicted O-methyltransferase YrrM